MIEFIVSKMGILLFAVSVASILILFSAEIKDIFVADEGMQISSVVSKKLKEMADSQSLCVSTYVSLPRYIDVIGGTSTPSTTSIYYTMDINIINPDGTGNKFVVFSLINKKTKKTMSVESFITDAGVSFKWNLLCSSDPPRTCNNGEDYLRVDPTDTSIIYMVKVNALSDTGQTIRKLFFIPCAYDKSAPDPMGNCFAVIKNLAKDEKAYCAPQSSPSGTVTPGAAP